MSIAADLARVMPRQKRGESEQSVQTPPNFMSAVKRHLCIDEFWMDLAAEPHNAVTRLYFDKAQDSLTQPWPVGPKWNWLNPPFANIASWVNKAREEKARGVHIAMLVPASVGSNWWANHVHEEAEVLFLNGRLTFVGHTTPYPKDLALLLYGENRAVGYATWKWKWDVVV